MPDVAVIEDGDECPGLGRLVSLAYRRGDVVHEIEWKGRRPMLCEHMPTGDLVILDGEEFGNTTRASKAARERYAVINWRARDPAAGGVLVPRFEEGDTFEELGELVCITYESDKSGELVHWFHAFEPHVPTLARHEESDALAIIGGDYKVTARGIVG